MPLPNAPLVSIVVPIYNVEKYLRQCLNSLVAQTYKNWEAVCVLDGPTDDSEAVLREIAASDTRFTIVSQNNQGLSVARNTGVSKSKGDFIFFLDSDDWLDENALQCLVAAAQRTQCPVICGAVTEYWEDTHQYRPYLKAKRRKLGKLTLRRQRFFDVETMAWNKLYKTELVKKNPFQAGLVHEDLEFYWRVFSSSAQVFAIPESIIFYRRRSGSLSNQKQYDTDYQNNFIRIADSAFDTLKVQPNLRVIFLKKHLRHLRELKKRNVPYQLYAKHIQEQFGIRESRGFVIQLKIRTFIDRILTSLGV